MNICKRCGCKFNAEPFNKKWYCKECKQVVVQEIKEKNRKKASIRVQKVRKKIKSKVGEDKVIIDNRINIQSLTILLNTTRNKIYANIFQNLVHKTKYNRIYRKSKTDVIYMQDVAYYLIDDIIDIINQKLKMKIVKEKKKEEYRGWLQKIQDIKSFNGTYNDLIKKVNNERRG